VVQVQAPEERYHVTYMAERRAHGHPTADSRKDPVWGEVYAMMDSFQPWNVGPLTGRWKRGPLEGERPGSRRRADGGERPDLHARGLPSTVFWQNLKIAAAETNSAACGEFLLSHSLYNRKECLAHTVLKIARC